MNTPFPAYNDYLSAAGNVSVLSIWLAERDAELAEHLRQEREALPQPFTKKKARLLFHHFREEYARKFGGAQGYQYKAITEVDLVPLLGALTVEERARRLEDAERRVRLLEQLRQNDMRELAALIQEFRRKGLVADADTDAILLKVSSQCDSVKEENRLLRLQLESQAMSAKQETYLLVALDELRRDNEALRGQLNELRHELTLNAASLQEAELLQALNEQLLARPTEDTVRELLLANLELRQEVMEKEATNETLERALAVQSRSPASRTHTEEEVELSRLLVEGMEKVVKRQEVEIATLQHELERQKLDLLECVRGVLSEEAEANRARLSQYEDQFRDSLDEARETIDLLQERQEQLEAELERLREMTVHELDATTGQLLATDRSLASLMENGAAFYVVQLRQPVVTQGHVAGLAGQATRAELLRASENHSGQYSVRLRFAKHSSEDATEVIVSGLDTVRQSPLSPPVLVASVTRTTDNVSFVHQGALPRHMVPQRGTLTVSAFVGQARLGQERHYAYALVGQTLTQVTFADGTLLYARYLSPTLYALDLVSVTLQSSP